MNFIKFTSQCKISPWSQTVVYESKWLFENKDWLVTKNWSQMKALNKKLKPEANEYKSSVKKQIYFSLVCLWLHNKRHFRALYKSKGLIQKDSHAVQFTSFNSNIDYLQLSSIYILYYHFKRLDPVNCKINSKSHLSLSKIAISLN